MREGEGCGFGPAVGASLAVDVRDMPPPLFSPFTGLFIVGQWVTLIHRADILKRNPS